MACKVTFLVYAILQLIAFLCVLIGTPLDMFRGHLNIFDERACVTLWGFKGRCDSIVYASDTDDRWMSCHNRRDRFRAGEALAVVSVMVYCAMFVFGFIMLYNSFALRWVCLALNVVGLLTLGGICAFMVVTYILDEGPLCPPLRTDFMFGVGFFLFLVAWVLNLVGIICLLLPVHKQDSVESKKSKENTPEE